MGRMVSGDRSCVPCPRYTVQNLLVGQQPVRVTTPFDNARSTGLAHLLCCMADTALTLSTEAWPFHATAVDVLAVCQGPSPLVLRVSSASRAVLPPKLSYHRNQHCCGLLTSQGNSLFLCSQVVAPTLEMLSAMLQACQVGSQGALRARTEMRGRRQLGLPPGVERPPTR